MTPLKIFSLTVFAAFSVGCGTHGAFDSTNATTSTTSTSSTTSSTSYNFVEPVINSQRNYVNTIIDNSSNSIPETIDETVSTVNTDGSYVIQQSDPTQDSVTYNGTTYSVPTETINFNNLGQKTSYVYTPIGGSLTTCSVSPHGAGPNYPIVVGDTWTSSYNVSCGSSSPISYLQTGTVIDVESVTVPAGTFTALRFQSTVTWTDASGTTHNETITAWRDIATDILVQENTTITYSGTTSVNGYPVTATRVLQSQY